MHSFLYCNRLCICVKYYIRITAEVSQILVSWEAPIYLEQFCLVYIRITCSIWYFIQFVRIAIFMSLHEPAGACIPVASASPIYVFPIQHVLKALWCAQTYIILYIHTHVIQNNLRTPQLVGFAHQLGYKKMKILILNFIYNCKLYNSGYGILSYSTVVLYM